MLNRLSTIFLIFRKATSRFSGSLYSTLGWVLPYYAQLIIRLERLPIDYGGSNTDVGNACEKGPKKLKVYHDISSKERSHSSIVTILDID